MHEVGTKNWYLQLDVLSLRLKAKNEDVSDGVSIAAEASED